MPHHDCHTLSYSEDVKGWPSFYSFCADYMVGMNGFFYTWSGGELFRHNTNPLRNTYYGVFTPSTINSVFNMEPQTIKLFKTMSYESDDRWACTALFSDLGNGSMLDTWFEEKEGEWFTFLRENAGTKDFRDRSVNGLGSSLTITGPITDVLITFNFDVGSIISVGDYIYSTVNSIYVGQVTDIVPQATIDALGVVTPSSITVDTTIPEPVLLTVGIVPAVGAFLFYLKDAVAESHGARGYFLNFTLENTNQAAVELFAVGSSLMKSYP
jgi:hypothetical protein|tara:strand:- start:2868 stop:3674 length:807 start_codon:yes stop_codon:yes gene_type:complete